jgi:hypothetical protein
VLIGRPAVQKKEASEPAGEIAIKKGILNNDGFLQGWNQTAFNKTLVSQDECNQIG